MKFDTILSVIAVLAVLAGAYYYFFVKSHFTPYRGPAPASAEKATARSLALYGDSISVPSRLGELMANVWFQNWAIAGSSLCDMVAPIGNLKALGEQITEDYHSALICRYGRNDAAFDKGLSLFTGMLRLFVTQARHSGKVPILCSLTQEIFDNDKAKQRWLAYNNAILTVAGTMGVHYIDVSSVPCSADELPDDVHPNAVYTERVDQFIAEYLKAKEIFPA